MAVDNIKVAIRVRALIAREVNAGAKVRWIIRDNTIYQDDPECKDACFVFDSISDHRKSNLDVFNEVARPIVASVMQGINGSVFAYGQTSSGKTYTMLGDSQAEGIIPLAIQEIFETIENTPDREFLLRVSYMEIYNEEIQDLLTGAKNLKIRETAEREVYVGDLKEQLVTDAQQIYKLMHQGEQRRHTGATNMNEHSSRSHTIFRVIVESRQRVCTGEESDLAVNVSHMNLVDLAGSERTNQTGATGDRLKEGCAINKSLFTLAYVICKLSEGESYVPFRDSKLTRILQNSLGGNSKTAIICTVTPAAVEETASTLKFASRAKNIRNRPTVNEVLSDEALLRRYRMQIQELQKQLEQSCSTTSLDSNHPDVAALEQQLAEKSRKESELRSLVDKLTQIICVSHSGAHSDQSSQAVGLVKKDKRRETWCPGKQPTRWNAFDDVGANFPKRRALQSHGGDDFGFVQSPEDMLNAAERCRMAEMEASEPMALPSALAPSPSVPDAQVLTTDAVHTDLDVASVSIQADIENPRVQELESQVFMLREENVLLKNLMEELECDLKSQHEKDVANLQQALQAAEWQRDELQKEVSSTQHDKSDRWDQIARPASPQVAADAQPPDEALQVALLHSQLHETARLLEARLEENARLVGQVDELVVEKTRLAQELETLKPRLGEQNNSLWAYETIESITDALSHLEVELSDLRSKNHNRSTAGVTNLSVQTTPSLHRADRAKALERTPVTPRTRANNSVVLDSAVAAKPENKILIDGLLAAQSRLDLLLDEARQLSDELGGQQQDASNSELEAHIKFLEGECSRLQAELDVTAKHRDDLLAQISEDRKASDVANAGYTSCLASLENECESLRRQLEVITRDRQSPLAAVQEVCRNEPVPEVSLSASAPVKLVEANDFTIFGNSSLDMTTYMDVLREQHTISKIPSLYEELRSAAGTCAVSPRPSMDCTALDQDSPPQVPHADAGILLSQELSQARTLIAELESERDILKAVNLTLEQQLHCRSTTLTTVDCQTSPCHPGGRSPQHGDRKSLSPSAAAATTPTVAVVLPQCYVIPEPPIIAVERNSVEAATNDDASTSTNERATCVVQPLDVDSGSKCPEPVEMQEEAAAGEMLTDAESEAARLKAALEEQLHVETCYMEAIAELRKDLDDMAAKLAVAEEENRRLRDSMSDAAGNKEPRELCGSRQDLPCRTPTVEACPSRDAGSRSALMESRDAVQCIYGSTSADCSQTASPAAALDELTTVLSASADDNARLRSELDARLLEIKKLSASLSAAECKARDDAVASENLHSQIQEQHDRNADLLEKLTTMTTQIDELSAKLLASTDENVKLQLERDERSMELESLSIALNAAECRARDNAMATESLRSETKELCDRNAGLVDRVAELAAQNAEMSSKLLSSETVISELQCELKSEKAEKLRIQEKIELITRETGASASKLAMLVDESNQLKSHIDGLNDEMEKLKSELASVDILLAESQTNAEFMAADFKEQLKQEREHASGLANQVKDLSEQLAANEKRLQLAEAESADLGAITGEQQREVSELHARIAQLEDCVAHEEAQRLQDRKRAEEALKSKEAQLIAAEASYRQELADKMAELGRKELKLQTIEREHMEQLRQFADRHLRHPAGSTPASVSHGGACDALASQTSDDGMASLREKYERAVEQAQQSRAEVEQLEAKLRQVELQMQPATAAAEEQRWKVLVREKDEQMERLQSEVQRLARCCEQANRTVDSKRAQCDELTATLAAHREQLRAMERERDEQQQSQATDDSLRSSTVTTPANSSRMSAATATYWSARSDTVARHKYEYAVQKATEYRKEKKQLAEKVKELQVKLETPSEYWQAIMEDKDDRIERLEAEVQRVMRCCEDADNELDDERRQHDELKAVAAELRERLSNNSGSAKSAANQSSTAAERVHDSLRAANFELRLKIEQLERELTEQTRPLRQQIVELFKEADSLRERCTFFKNEARRLQTSQHDVTVGMKKQANAATQCDLSADCQRLLGADSVSAAGGGSGTWNPSLPVQPPGCGVVEELERDRLRQEVQRLRRQLRQAQAPQPPSAQAQPHGQAAAAAYPTSTRAAVTASTEAAVAEPAPSIVQPLQAGGSKLPATSAKAAADIQPPRPALSGITNSPKRTLHGHTKFFPAVSKLDSPLDTARGPVRSNQPQPPPAVDDDITGCKQQ